MPPARSSPPPRNPTMAASSHPHGPPPSPPRRRRAPIQEKAPPSASPKACKSMASSLPNPIRATPASRNTATMFSVALLAAATRGPAGIGTDEPAGPGRSSADRHGQSLPVLRVVVQGTAGLYVGAQILLTPLQLPIGSYTVGNNFDRKTVTIPPTTQNITR